MHDEIDSKKLWLSETDFYNLFNQYFASGFKNGDDAEVDFFFEILQDYTLMRIKPYLFYNSILQSTYAKKVFRENNYDYLKKIDALIEDS